MPVYVAMTYKGFVESVVLADSYELAQAYWQGVGVSAHSVVTRTETDLVGHPTGVLPIVKTRRVRASKFGQREQEFLVIK